MENLEEETKRIASTMVQISEIITTSGMSGICILHKGKGNVVALLIQGTTLDIIPAVVSVMKNHPVAREILLTACECYKCQENEQAVPRDMPAYLKEFIEDLFRKG
jgi:hypothetical protein